MIARKLTVHITSNQNPVDLGEVNGLTSKLRREIKLMRLLLSQEMERPTDRNENPKNIKDRMRKDVLEGSER